MGSQGIGCDTPAQDYTIRVPGDYATIAEAIAVACDLDTVLVAPGTYREAGLRLDEPQVFLTGTAPRDSATVAATVIDAERSSPVLEVFDSGLQSTISGLTLTGGLGWYGGGVEVQRGARPRIEWCQIVGNESLTSGGGVLVRGTVAEDESLAIINCRFTDNIAAEKGGGCWLAGEVAEPPVVRVQSCVFRGNSAQESGGGAFGTAVLFERCDFRNNTTLGSGGGLIASNAWLDYCVIEDNQASGGGGAHLTDSEVVGCRIAGNTAENGGGLFLYSWNRVENATLADNRAYEGAGLFLRWLWSRAQINNTVVWGNHGPEIGPDGEPLTISYSIVEGGWPGTGNLAANPRFFARAGLSLLPGPGSPAIDSGDPALEDDLYDWHPWWPGAIPDGARSDMGAYGGPGNRSWLDRERSNR